MHPHRYRIRLSRKPSLAWGPFCWLRQQKHPEPFAKRLTGHQRRMARRFKQSLHNSLLNPPTQELSP